MIRWAAVFIGVGLWTFGWWFVGVAIEYWREVRWTSALRNGYGSTGRFSR